MSAMQRHLTDHLLRMRMCSSDHTVRLSEEDATKMARELYEYDRFALRVESVVWTSTYHVIHYTDVDGNDLTFVKSYSNRLDND
jgi:hypothetical protein